MREAILIIIVAVLCLYVAHLKLSAPVECRYLVVVHSWFVESLSWETKQFEDYDAAYLWALESRSAHTDYKIVKLRKQLEAADE